MLTITTSGVFFCSDHVHHCRADGLLTWPVVNNHFRGLNALTLLINNSGWCFVCGSWSVNWSCVTWCASCPSQQSANTPHCAVSLKVWWISLWCLKTLLLATQTERQLHERGLCFCSFPLQCLSRPIRFEQTLQCLKNLWYNSFS